MKKFVSIFMTLAMMFTMCNVAFASGTSSKLFDPDMGVPGEATNFANKILGFVQWAGYAIAVGMLIYVGIKYVMASANEKADLKNSLIKYVIGAVLIAGAVTIAGWVFEIGV